MIYGMTMEKMLKALLIGPLLSPMAGCGVMAALCRVALAALKMVPSVGHVAALPTDGCAAVTD